MLEPEDKNLLTIISGELGESDILDNPNTTWENIGDKLMQEQEAESDPRYHILAVAAYSRAHLKQEVWQRVADRMFGTMEDQVTRYDSTNNGDKFLNPVANLAYFAHLVFAAKKGDYSLFQIETRVRDAISPERVLAHIRDNLPYEFLCDVSGDKQDVLTEEISKDNFDRFFEADFNFQKAMLKFWQKTDSLYEHYFSACRKAQDPANRYSVRIGIHSGEVAIE